MATVHALTTEAEEVMGLLLGDVHVSMMQLNCCVMHPASITFPHALHWIDPKLPCSQYGNNGEAVARITVAVPQIRADRRKVVSCRACSAPRFATCPAA